MLGLSERLFLPAGKECVPRSADSEKKFSESGDVELLFLRVRAPESHQNVPNFAEILAAMFFSAQAKPEIFRSENAGGFSEVFWVPIFFAGADLSQLGFCPRTGQKMLLRG